MSALSAWEKQAEVWEAPARRAICHYPVNGRECGLVFAAMDDDTLTVMVRKHEEIVHAA